MSYDPLSVSVHEIEPLEQQEGCELPTGSLELTEELGQLAIELKDSTEELGQAYSDFSKDKKGPRLDNPIWGRELLDDLETTGRLTHEETLTLLGSTPLLHRLAQRQDKGEYKLIDLLAEYSTGLFHTNDRKIASQMIPQESRKVIRAIMDIINRGVPLLNNLNFEVPINSLHNRVEAIENSILDVAEQAPEFKKIPDDRGSIPLLKTLWAIDCAIHVASIPDEIRDKGPISDSPEKDKMIHTTLATNELLETAFGDDIDSIRKNIIYYIYDHKKLHSKVTGRIKKEYRPHIDRLKELVSFGNSLGLFEATQDFIESMKSMDSVRTVQDNASRINETEKRLIKIAEQLFQMSQEHAHEIPSESRMLGSLVVESWVSRQLEGIYGEGIITDSLGRARPIHEVLESHEEQQQIIRREKLINLIDEIDDKYSISSNKVRNLEGGLALRKQLEDWTDPGSQKRVFMRDQAQQLTGISLDTVSYPDIFADFDQLNNLWIQLQNVDGSLKRSGLLASIDTLRETRETANSSQLNSHLLKPLWTLLDVIDGAIENEQDNAPGDDDFPHQETIMPFPPEPSDIEIDDIEGELRGIIGGNPHKYAVEWERITSLVELHKTLKEKGYPVAAVRFPASKWHRLPHYALEIKGKGEDDKVLSIIESPIYGNATYVIPFPEWRDVIAFSKEEARQLGAIPRIHEKGKATSDHRAKLLADIGKILR